MNEAERRIQSLLDAEESVPERDGAGVITAHGVDAAVRRKCFAQCLQIVKECKNGK